MGKDGSALRFAAQEFCADKEVVLVAVASNGYALELAAPELRSDPEVVLAAAAQTEDALILAPPELREDPKFKESLEALRMEKRGRRSALAACGSQGVDTPRWSLAACGASGDSGV